MSSSSTSLLFNHRADSKCNSYKLAYEYDNIINRPCVGSQKLREGAHLTFWQDHEKQTFFVPSPRASGERLPRKRFSRMEPMNLAAWASRGRPFSLSRSAGEGWGEGAFPSRFMESRGGIGRGEPCRTRQATLNVVNLLSPPLSSTSLWRRGRYATCSKSEMRPAGSKGRL